MCDHIKANIQCSCCNTKHVRNTLFCGECGQYLGEDASLKTGVFLKSVLSSAAKRARNTLAANGKQSLSTGPLFWQSDFSRPVLHLRVNGKKREIRCRLTRTIHIGRADPAHGIFFDVDLTAADQLKREVSRRHLRILDRGSAVMIEDLDSFNGTFLNGEKLPPFEPKILSTGDQLRLGSLRIEIAKIKK